MVCPPRSPITLAVVLLSMSGLAAPVDAEVVSSSDTHFVLRHQAASRLSAAALWERLLTPSDWWHPDHTYSGDAGNLTLEPTAGGLWREDWDGGSVAHGQVIAVMRGRMLRMEAPFGPLQGVGARVVWTITVEADGAGSTVRFEESASGPPSAGLDQLAAAVDAVKSQAIARLATPPTN